MMQKALAAVVGMAVLVGGYLALRTPPQAPPAKPTRTPVDANPSPGTPPASAALPATQTVVPAEPVLVAGTPKDHPDWVAYPDGTAYPPLNGVQKAPAIIWHRSMPFAKVVRVERDRQGRDWYVHENGIRSTTYLDARGQPISDVAMAQPVMPILDDTVPK